MGCQNCHEDGLYSHEDGLYFSDDQTQSPTALPEIAQMPYDLFYIAYLKKVRSLCSAK